MKRFGICIMVLFAAIILNCSFSNAKLMSYTKGNFKYKYEFLTYGAWIVKITPLSNKGIEKLVIPEELGGEKVIRIGGYETGDDQEENIFGVWDNPEGTGLEPLGLVNKMDKIKTIVLPKSLESMSIGCFSYMGAGKSINIPAGFVENVLEVVGREQMWKKVTISPKHPLYRIKEGCLLSKNGKQLYTVLTMGSKVVIPNKVKRIDQRVKFDHATKELYIPKSVKKIESPALECGASMKVTISEKNKNYGVEKGSVYSKRSGRLVMGYVDSHGLLDIPNKVTNIWNGSYAGGKVKKIIIPKSVKKIECFWFGGWSKPEKLTIVCKRKVPPVLKEKRLDSTFSFPIELKMIVPKGCKSRYQKKWKPGINTLVRKISYIEAGS